MHKLLGLLILPFAFSALLSITINNLNVEKVPLSKRILITGLDKINKPAYESSSLIIKNSFSPIDIHLNSHKDFVIESNIANNIPDQSSEIFLTHSIQLSNYDWKRMFSKKKVKFIETVLPIINFENKKILNERRRLIELKKYLHVEKTLIDGDIIYLNTMIKKYQIQSKNKHKMDLLDELLILVDVIPNSIVLAQAVNESGWGTSRFAKEHNALFGEYTYDESEGVIPFEREEGKKHLIRNFSSFTQSVESYFRNINTHYAYEEFREIRSQINKKNLLINIKLLTQTLDVYAEDEFYVDTINSIIDSNKFNQFDILI